MYDHVDWCVYFIGRRGDFSMGQYCVEEGCWEIGGFISQEIGPCTEWSDAIYFIDQCFGWDAVMDEEECCKGRGNVLEPLGLRLGGRRGTSEF